MTALILALVPQTMQHVDIPLADAQNNLWTPVAIEGAGFLPSKLTITGHVDSSWQLVVENMSPNMVGAWFGDSPIYGNDEECYSKVSFRLPGGSPFAAAQTSLPTFAIRLAPHDGALDFAGQSGFTSPWMRTTGAVSITVTDPAVLSLFAGKDDVQLEVERFGWVYFASTNAGNFWSGGLNKVAASLTFAFEP